jgi:hypothetical protein
MLCWNVHHSRKRSDTMGRGGDMKKEKKKPKKKKR